MPVWVTETNDTHRQKFNEQYSNDRFSRIQILVDLF
jgi:hypothetical protein